MIDSSGKLCWSDAAEQRSSPHTQKTYTLNNILSVSKALEDLNFVLLWTMSLDNHGYVYA